MLTYSRGFYHANFEMNLSWRDLAQRTANEMLKDDAQTSRRSWRITSSWSFPRAAMPARDRQLLSAAEFYGRHGPHARAVRTARRRNMP
jgi:hypothetical protein